MTKRIFVALIAIAMLFIASGCSSVSTDSDEQAIHYKGGSFSSKSFQDCIKPSTREYNGPGDEHYVYPKGQRTYSFTGLKGSETTPMQITTGSQEVYVPGFVTFTLTTDCDLLRKFHETVGKKYGAYSGGGGWGDFLNDYINIPLSAVLNEAAGAIKTPEGQSTDQNWYVLYTKVEAQKEFEDYVTTNLPAEIEKTLGDKYITVNAVSISKPDVGKELKASLSAKEAARLDNEAQKERNVTAQTKYDSLGACKKVVSEATCLTIYLAETGDIDFFPIPQGGNINVSPPAGQ